MADSVDIIPKKIMVKLEGTTANSFVDIDKIAQLVIDKILPVGSFYQTTDDSFDPNTAFGGTWQRVENGKFLEAGDGTNGKTKRDAGLPTASGTFGCLMVSNAQQSGACTLTGANRLSLGITAGSNPCISDTVQVHLSNSNRIFGASNTVQPSSYVINIWERVA